jgi:hypothetical protein
MKNKKSLYQFRFLILLLVVASFSLGFLGDDKSGTKPNSSQTLYKPGAVTEEGGKKGDAYRLNVNNLNIPFNRKGTIAAVNIPDPNPIINGAGGKFGGHVFLFSGGFMLSGYSNGTLFANAMASASLIENYTQGVAGSSGDPNAQLYVLKSSDAPFGTAWQDWKDAVTLGADFYDGDGDGVYNPVDKNGNGIWDPDEDKPDILGDETLWCAYWDGVPAAQRQRFNNVPPLGIEVRQTAFAYASGGAIGNLIFVRYRFKYVGLGTSSEPEQLDSVFFGVWSDVDLGTATDDLVGSDVGRNAGYTYNNGPDGEYGSQPPCFMIDFFSGPVDYIAGETYEDVNLNGVYDDGIDTALDTAYSYRGQTIGIKTFPGAKNLGIASFIQYINGDPVINDPDTKEAARSYMLGKTRTGADVDPCTFSYGTVKAPVLCGTVDPRFWYSGDPVAANGVGTGWINTTASDCRQMTNTGPFDLKKGEEKEIVVAYVVGQGANHLDAITVARAIDDGAQTIFNLNFLAPSPPPAPVVTTESSEEFIDLLWPTQEQFLYSSVSETWDVKLGGYNVYALQTYNSSETINNQPNIKLIGRYQVKNFIKDLYAKDGTTGGIELLFAAADSNNTLDSNIYKDAATGKLRFRLTQDPFTGLKLVKGKPYYLLVTAYGVNFDALINKGGGAHGDYGDYYLTDQTFVQAVENPKALSLVRTVLMGEDIYLPPIEVSEVTGNPGPSKGRMQIDVVDKEALTGDTYRVTFTPDKSTQKFSSFWNLENKTTGVVLLDSVKDYLYNNTQINFQSTDGFIVKLENQTPDLGKIRFETSSEWYNPDTTLTNFFFLTQNIDDGTRLTKMPGNLVNNYSTIATALDLRNVELRYGEQGKAYRYIVGVVGANPPARRNAYVYAEGITAANPLVQPTFLAQVGKVGEGYVDVPFTAWVKDDAYGESRQLAVGFLERASTDGGNPDGIWDPGTSIDSTAEFIFIFNAPYDPNGNQQEYKGNFAASSVVWADLKGYTIPNDASATPEQRQISLSPYFNTLYAVSVQKKDLNSTYAAGDKFIFPVSVYPYSSQDVFEFTTNKGGVLTEAEEKSLFEKVNVFPNPLYGYNPYTAYNNLAADDPFVTFTNLPNEEITIKVYSLSGTLLRTLVKDPNSTSPFLNWNLQNESGLRVASGLYIAIVSSPKYGDKVLKFSLIMPQKQLPRF